jgi:hypothetical protein
MSRAPSDLEERRAFSVVDRHSILMRQSVIGADGVRYALCDGEACGAQLARLSATGEWNKLRPFDFDHGLARGLYGKTTAFNGRAVCSGEGSCHALKTSEDVARIAKADRMAGRSGQAARRAARRAAGKAPLIKGKGFPKHG